MASAVPSSPNERNVTAAPQRPAVADDTEAAAKVKIASTPSRDSQLKSHWLRAPASALRIAEMQRRGNEPAGDQHKCQRGRRALVASAEGSSNPNPKHERQARSRARTAW